MARTVLAALVVAAVSILVTGCAQTRPVSADTIQFQASTNWVLETPLHPARRLQFRVPSGNQAAPPAKLVVWNFPNMRDRGDGQVIQRNMSRWCEQFVQGDGQPTRAAANMSEWNVNGMPVHVIDVQGRYVAETAPGSGLHVNRPGYRMLGAYIVAPDGDYIVRMVGPLGVVQQHEGEFMDFVRSARSGMPPAMQPGERRQGAALAADRITR
jgi:hypothetical protein